MPNAQNASSGFALRTYRDPKVPVNILAQRGPDEAPERLRAAARRGENPNRSISAILLYLHKPARKVMGPAGFEPATSAV